ncbi:type IV toxin-antitoxin system AbiEi family antitoxin domain-containing protein [Gordonia sp. (in: high G+C Gram-positive bacteria)]|uniref:type IV toxin-antitoxin system AbiEi family antitoxin domain-containing protein n=1 Tax=Gordonia sp. (in: high G+C Gram-positive bacteria) TaxID=84139 RepID=UPI0039E309CA
MAAIDFGDDGYLRAQDAAARGLTTRELNRAVENGTLVRICRGVFAPPADRVPLAAHRLAVLGMDAAPGTVVSHSSAAALHRMPMLRPDLSKLHLTSSTTDRGYQRSHRHVHPGNLAEHDVVIVDGLRVTSLERTAFDVARTSPHGFAGALAAFDSALRLGANRRSMARYGREPRTGVGTAREALKIANGLSDNPGESWGRALMYLDGLPMPRIQTEVFDEYGVFVARPDYDWVDEAGNIVVVGEFDGLGKYLKYLRPGEDVDDALRREKERESRLQDLGIIVVRWTWSDLYTPNRITRRIRIQLERTGLL